mgnify:CR=1 FL=1
MTYEKNGAVRRNRSHGARDRQYYYKPAPENKGYGNSTTTPKDVTNYQEAHQVLGEGFARYSKDSL